MNIKNELQKIANNQDSFLGMDGGNIERDVWVCGIEFGGEIEKMEEYYNEKCIVFEGDGDIPYRTDCPDYMKRSYYDRYLSAFYINLFESRILENGNDLDYIMDIHNYKLYNQDSKIFKLNLYPLAKPDTSWDKKITEKYKIDKDKYYGEYFESRKKFITSLVDKHKPKLILATSTPSYISTFKTVFIPSNVTCEFNWEEVTTRTNNKFQLLEYAFNGTKLVIMPFLGRNNLKSYNDVIDYSNYLRDKYCLYLRE